MIGPGEQAPTVIARLREALSNPDRTSFWPDAVSGLGKIGVGDQ